MGVIADVLKEFFGFGGYQREPEGYFSWQHLTFVSCLMVVMLACSLWLGLRNRHRSARTKNRVLIITAILIDSLELFKIVLLCFRSQDPMNWVKNLPLFLCSILLIAIPLAAFAGGRVKEAALDFVLIFGPLAAIIGTYMAGNNYGSYPVLGFDNVISGLTHSISGFAAFYILFSGMASMKKRNIWITYLILGFFCTCAFTANALVDYNYMFLRAGDGTPYDLLYNLVGGNPILYPIGVIVLFLLYILAFYMVYFIIRLLHKKQRAK